MAPDGSRARLLALRWPDTRMSAEGIQIFSAGVEDQEQQLFRFERADMEEAGISRFDPAGYFMLEEHRWDVVGGHPQAFNQDPSATVFVMMRKAVEKRRTVCGSTFDFDTNE